MIVNIEVLQIEIKYIKTLNLIELSYSRTRTYESNSHSYFLTTFKQVESFLEISSIVCAELDRSNS